MGAQGTGATTNLMGGSEPATPVPGLWDKTTNLFRAMAPKNAKEALQLAETVQSARAMMGSPPGLPGAPGLPGHRGGATLPSQAGQYQAQPGKPAPLGLRAGRNRVSDPNAVLMNMMARGR